jgi:enoyl-CoA hydratase/carnithine racemase
MIAAIEGRAYVYSEYALLANVIVASEAATFRNLPHFAGGSVPSDGSFTAWSYRSRSRLEPRMNVPFTRPVRCC